MQRWCYSAYSDTYATPLLFLLLNSKPASSTPCQATCRPTSLSVPSRTTLHTRVSWCDRVSVPTGWDSLCVASAECTAEQGQWAPAWAQRLACHLSPCPHHHPHPHHRCLRLSLQKPAQPLRRRRWGYKPRLLRSRVALPLWPRQAWERWALGAYSHPVTPRLQQLQPAWCLGYEGRRKRTVPLLGPVMERSQRQGAHEHRRAWS